MGLFRESCVLMFVTSPEWPLRLVTARVSSLDRRQSVDTCLDTGRVSAYSCLSLQAAIGQIIGVSDGAALLSRFDVEDKINLYDAPPR